MPQGISFPERSAFVYIHKEHKAQERNAKAQSKAYLRGGYHQATWHLVKAVLNAALLSCFTSRTVDPD